MIMKKNEAVVLYSSEWNTYSAKERQCRSDYNRRAIDGRIIGSCKCVGYCDYDGHPGFLNEKLRKKHDCIKKNCLYYIAKPKCSALFGA